MKHAIIVAHPNAHSFNLTMARAYQTAAERAGGKTVLRDLYRLGFDPTLADSEIPRPGGFKPGADVIGERGVIGDADVFAFIYPFWFNSPPAMMKGYIDRVFGMGFGFGPGAEGNEPLLGGCQLVSVTSSGAPRDWVVDTGAWAAERNLFDEHVSRVCGLSVVDHIHFGDIVPGVTVEMIQECAGQVAEMVKLHFAEPVVAI